jgi:hypothetical protein
MGDQLDISRYHQTHGLIPLSDVNSVVLKTGKVAANRFPPKRARFVSVMVRA